MTFTGFEQADFDTFTIGGLEPRMQALRARIQPKFRALGEDIVPFLSKELGQPMYLHVAQHARRTVNAPNDTWSAYCHNKRGYKKHPHFQIGLYDDHLFVWLAFIYEVPHKKEIAELFLAHQPEIMETIPHDYLISVDHMKKEAQFMRDIDFTDTLTRFKDVKKTELLIGKHFKATDAIVKNGPVLLEEIKSIYKTLAPLYHLSFKLM